MAVYPHKQTVFIFICCVIVVGGFYYYVFGSKNQAASEKITDTLATALTAPEKLPENEWQKQFLDKNILAGTYKAPDAASKAAAVEKNTATYKLGQNFLTQYITLRQNGLTENETAVNASIDRALEESGSALPPAKLYSEKDIAIITESTSAIKNYQQVIRALSARYDARLDEADLAVQAFEGGDLSQLSKLDGVILEYKGILSQLRAVVVPKSYTGNHLALMNSMSLLLYSSQAFRKMEDDPLTGLSAIKIDALATQAADELFTRIQNQLAGKGLSINQ